LSTGRKPIPVSLIDNSVQRLTQEEINARSAYEVFGCDTDLTPPKELSPDGVAEWHRIIELYGQLDTNILNNLDRTVLSAYCESTAIYQRAQREYQKGSLVLKDPKGKIIENPYLAIMRKEAANIAKLAEQLCLSPVGRARMGIFGAKKELASDSTIEFFKRYGYDG